MKSIQLFSFLIAANLFLACTGDSQNWYGNGIKGEGPTVTEKFDLSSFDGIGLSIDANVYLSQGSQSVKIEAQKNILDNIVMDVNDGFWKIKFDKNVRNHEPIKIWVTIPNLTTAAVSGSGDIIGETSFTGLDKLKLAISGSGDIEMDTKSTSLDVSISGSGGMELKGSTGDCKIRISGSGDVDAGKLVASDCTVKIAGSGDASVHVNGSLDVGIAGSGDVYYDGNPRVKSKISGSGDVQAKR